jgi:exoribonuclease R
MEKEGACTIKGPKKGSSALGEYRVPNIVPNLLPDFSAEALGEPGKLRIPAGIVDGSVKGPQHVRDMRSLLWASIDNDDSRDLDQLTVAESTSGETVKIRVAIADVDSLVKNGSAIDEHARHNTTSVYTAAEIFPMLPERVSTDLTSLKPSQDHLSIVVETVVDADDFLQDSSIYGSWVRNHAKRDYGSVGAWLENEGAIAPKVDEIWLPKIGGAGIKLPAYLT